MDRRHRHKLTDRAKEDAIAWHVRLTSDEACDGDYEAFSEWLSADPENFNAFAQVEEFSGRIDAVRDVGATAFNHLLEKKRGDERTRLPLINSFSRAEKFVAAIAATLLVVIAAGYYVQFGPPAERMAIMATATEFRKVDLNDGSAITLGPGATIETVFSRKSRRVTSLNGNVFFDVESNHKRPFTIVFGSGEIRVVGTQFEVSSFSERQSVAVAKGVVTVRMPSGATIIDQTNLFPGDRLTLSDAPPSVILDKTPAEEIGAWRGGYLEFNDAGMNEIVSRLNTFYGRPVFSFDDNALVGVQFDGILKLSDPAGTARHLAELMPVTATETEAGILLQNAPADQ